MSRTFKPRSAAAEKKGIQNRIWVWYHDRVLDNRMKLCRTCNLWDGNRCIRGLFPVTSSGEDCPYYQIKEKED